MGNDGGSIPKRGELVKSKKLKLPPSRASIARLRQCACAISKAPLQPPVVCDGLGNLYNKEVLIEALLTKSLPAEFNHLRKLSDVFPVKLTEETHHQGKKPETSSSCQVLTQDQVDTVGLGGIEEGRKRFVCPLSRVPLDSLHRFTVLARCGCVLSTRAVREIGGKTCPNCGQVAKKEDEIPLNADEKETALLVQRLLTKKRLARLKKKSKKRKQGTVEGKGEKSTSRKKGNASQAESRKRSRVLSTAELAVKEAREQLDQGSDTFKSLFQSKESKELKQETGSSLIRNFCGTGV